MSLRSELSFRAVLVLLGCLACQLGSGFFYGTRALAPDVIQDLGWTRTMWSSAMTPMLLMSSVSQALVGAACVRFGVRPVILTSVACLGATFVVLATMQGIWQFYIAVVLLALGNAGIGDVAIGAVVTQWFRRARGLALGFAFMGSNLGGVVFVHAITAITAADSWRAAALSVGLGGVAVILPFALFVVREPRSGESPTTRADVGGTAGPAPAAISLSQAIRRPAFWICFYAMFCYAFAQLGLADHLILYLRDLGYSRTEAAGTLELAIGAGILSKLGAGVLALRLSPRKAFVANTTLLATSLALIPFADREWVLPIFGVAYGVAIAARDVLFPLVVVEIFGARYFAQLYGFIMISYFPGGALGPLALGSAYDVLGSYEMAFLGFLVLVAIAPLALLLLPRAESD